MGKKVFFNSKAQGTIEYLIILAVVVIVGLIVVALFVGVANNPSQEISNSSSKASEIAVGGISIVESVVDSEGDSLLFVNNNSSDSITLKKISSGGVDNNYNTVLVGLDSKGFSLSGLSNACPCSSGQKNVKCEFKLEYETASGITKTEYRTVSVQCVTDSTPKEEDKIIAPIVAEVVLEDGTSEHPWIINDCQELQDMNLNLDGNYQLNNDIDCSLTRTWNNGLGFSPVGTCDYECNQNGLTTANFKGSLNGNGHKITNLYINRPSEYYIGLFGYVTDTNIENVGLEDVNITGGIVVGALAGTVRTNCVIENSFSKGIVTSADSTVGGLIGMLDRATVQKSYSTATVRGVSIVGGFVGSIDAFVTINNCYATGAASGTTQVGGFSGRTTFSEINNSYSSGLVTGDDSLGGFSGPNMVGTATDSYWDIESSGQESSELGEGKTTTQMKQQATYQNWDFDTIWEIQEGTSYPTLR
jgi:hypothetical protein